MKETNRFFRLGVYILVVVLLNLAGASAFVRFDLTENRIYSLSSVSRKVVAQLREPLTITVFFSPDLPAPYNTVEQYLRDILEEYALYANRNFNYRFLSPGAEGEPGPPSRPDLRKIASDYGIHPVQIQVVEKDEVKFKSAYMGLVIVQGDMIERIGAVTGTEGLEYKLTTSMQRLNNKISALSGLKDKIEVTLYLSRSLSRVAPQIGLKDLETMPKQIETAVGDLNRRLYGTIAYSHADPEDTGQMKDLSERYNLLMLTWPDLGGGSIPAGAGVAGLVASYRGRTYTIPVIQAVSMPLFGTQYRLATADGIKEALEQSIESLVGINETLGYLADRGTLPLSGQPGSAVSTANFQDLASRVYTIKDITLDRGIPEGLGCLLIVRPTEPFSDADLYQIDQALMRGTSLAILLDPFVEKQASDPASPQGRLEAVDTGLEKLLEHYGIGVRRSLALDMNCFKQRMPRQFGGAEQPIYYAPILKGSQITTGEPFMRNIREIVTYKAAPLSIDRKRLTENGLSCTVLLSTSEKSWELDNPAMLNPMFIRPPDDTSVMAAKPLACLVEGRFPSYFAGKNDPAGEAGPVGGGKQSPGTKGPDGTVTKPLAHRGGTVAVSKPAKIFLMGSSEMITDNLVSEEGTNPNAIFIMNVLDVLNHRDDLALLRGKIQTVNPLTVTDESLRALAKAFNIVGLCLLVIIAGLGVWLRRAARRKRIASLFARGGGAS